MKITTNTQPLRLRVCFGLPRSWVDFWPARCELAHQPFFDVEISTKGPRRHVYTSTNSALGNQKRRIRRVFCPSRLLHELSIDEVKEDRCIESNESIQSLINPVRRNPGLGNKTRVTAQHSTCSTSRLLPILQQGAGIPAAGLQHYSITGLPAVSHLIPIFWSIVIRCKQVLLGHPAGAISSSPWPWKKTWKCSTGLQQAPSAKRQERG